jgi:putative hemolysin
VTFRAVGEGTGRAVDLDDYDSYYRHLILWNKEDARIAGSYRLAWTEDVFADPGARGLYTSTLFRFSPEFFSRVGPAVELGRSFVRPEYQREHTPLFLLWRAIGLCVCQRPDAPVLFGAVSISSAICDAAREMIFEFLQHRRARNDLSGLVKPRRPFRPRLLRKSELQLLAKSFEDIEDLNGPLRDVDSRMSIPVLLRHYLKLGGRVAAFNIDRKFSNALDALLVVDLRETPPRLLAKYMGQQSARQFQSVIQ